MKKIYLVVKTEHYLRVDGFYDHISTNIQAYINRNIAIGFAKNMNTCENCEYSVEEITLLS